MTNTNGFEHLLLGRADLVSRRDKLNRAIEALDEILREYGVQAETSRPTTSERTATPASESHTPTVREAILRSLASEPRDFPMTEIINNVKAQGAQGQDDTVRSIIVKLTQAGAVTRPRRGFYRSAEMFGDIDVSPTNAEDPVAAGPSGLSLLNQEGGTRLDERPAPDAVGANHSHSDTHGADPVHRAAVGVAAPS